MVWCLETIREFIELYMQKKDDKYVLSAGDVNGFLNCKRLTELDTQVANGSLLKPEIN